MNYYQFHIGDWSLHTSHLSLEEEAVYRKLLDYYYDTEEPIPEETYPVIRRLRLAPYKETVEVILREFFILRSDGWHNPRADREIEAYQAKAERARSNGRRGGRPKKRSLRKQEVIENKNPEETGSKANHKPLTINHNKKPSSKVESDEDVTLAEKMYQRILTVAPKAKKPNLQAWAKTLRLMRERDNLTNHEICKVFIFANNDPFWSANILSPDTLRRQFPKLHAKVKSNETNKPAVNGYQAGHYISPAERFRAQLAAQEGDGSVVATVPRDLRGTVGEELRERTQRSLDESPGAIYSGSD